MLSRNSYITKLRHILEGRSIETWTDGIISRHFHLRLEKPPNNPKGTPNTTGQVWEGLVQARSPGMAASATVPVGTW